MVLIATIALAWLALLVVAVALAWAAKRGDAAAGVTSAEPVYTAAGGPQPDGAWDVVAAPVARSTLGESYTPLRATT